MPNSLKIGLVGSGFMAQAHADAYRRAGFLYRNLSWTPVLYAIADQNESLAESARRKLGFAKAYDDWQRLTESVSVIFAISVCKTPIRKDDPHGDRKERKGTDDHESTDHPNRIGFCDLLCEYSDR